MADCNCGENCGCSEKKDFTEQAKVFKALAHPSRLLMLNSLRDGKCCVCELQKLVGSDISTVSKHLKVLKECSVVDIEKEGNFIYYHLKMPCVLEFLDCITENKGCTCSNG